MRYRVDGEHLLGRDPHQGWRYVAYRDAAGAWRAIVPWLTDADARHIATGEG
jgi:hypothetical protein